MLLEEEIAKFDSMALEWWDINGKFKPLHQFNPIRIKFMREAMIKHFGLQASNVKPLKGLTLLDVGCGGGLISEPMARLGAEVLGIDASETTIRVAQSHMRESELSLNYRKCLIEDLIHENKQFDVVLNLEIVEHVPNVNQFLCTSAKLVKPCGLLIAATLNRTLKSFALAIVGAEYVLRWLPRGTHDWQKFVKPHEMVSALRSQGMHLSKMEGLIYNPFTDQWRTSEHDLAVNYIAAFYKNNSDTLG